MRFWWSDRHERRDARVGVASRPRVAHAVRAAQAAGGCTIRWNGRDYAVVDPEIIDWETAKPTFSRVERIFAPLFADHFVRLRFAPAGPAGAASHQ